jgi:cyclase
MTLSPPPLRVIPRLDVKGANLVKGIHLEGLRVLGTPDIYARRYAEEGADEILFMDAVASLYERNNLSDVVSRTARDVFIPITVGGGIRTLDDIAAALKAGADKVAINTQAIRQPKFISQAAERYGSSTIVVHIDAKRSKGGAWVAWTENGREASTYDVVNWAQKAEALGCGEIMVTSIDNEGTTRGYDIALCQAVAGAVSVPVIVSGGAGTPEHASAVAKSADISALAIASLLHYRVAADLESEGFAFDGAGQFKVIAEKRDSLRVKPASIAEVKAHLRANGLECRPLPGELA